MKSIRDVLIEAGLSEDQLDAVTMALPAPDADRWNPDPDYLRELLEQAGLSQRAATRVIGVPVRRFRDYFSGKDIPYPTQYALEMLAFLNIPGNDRKRESEDSND